MARSLHFVPQAAYFANVAGSALPGGPGMTMAPGEVPPLTPPGGNVGGGGGGEVGESVGGGGGGEVGESVGGGIGGEVGESVGGGIGGEVGSPPTATVAGSGTRPVRSLHTLFWSITNCMPRSKGLVCDARWLPRGLRLHLPLPAASEAQRPATGESGRTAV